MTTVVEPDSPALHQEHRTQQFPIGIRHEPGIDGLRGYGVLMVVLFHAGLMPERAGAYTVGSFFVLSGFLITRMTIAGWSATGTFRTRDFLVQRLIRLYPSLLLTVASTMAWVWWIGPLAGRAPLLANATTVLTHTFNFHLLDPDQVGYARLFTAKSPWSHLWSVSIEEQFYLLFAPVAAWAFFRFGQRRVARALIQLLAGAALAFSVVQLVVGATTKSTAIMYLRTDSRVSEFLIGALIGAMFAKGTFSKLAGHWVSIAGFVSIVAVTISWYVIPRESLSSYFGGLQIHAVAVGVVAVAACTGGHFRRFIGNRVLARIGVWSYAIYLFHWPAMVMVQHWRRSSSPTLALAAGAASIALAGLVTRYFERPIRSAGKRRQGAIAAVLLATAALLIGSAVALDRSWSFVQRLNARTDGRLANFAEPPPGDPRPHVVMVSDSLGSVMLASMARMDTETVWSNRAQSGCILTSDKVWWVAGWEGRSNGTCKGVIDRVAGELRPIDTVIFAFGNGDSRERLHHGTIVSVETHDGRRIVAGEIRRYLRTLSDTGARVIAINIGPSMSYAASGMEAVEPSQARAWNDTLADVVRQDYPDVDIVPMNELFGDDYAPVSERNGCVLRGTDGFHLSQCGGDLAAQLVLTTLHG